MLRLVPIRSRVVLFCGSYLGSYKVIPKRNYYGAYGYASTTKTFDGVLHGRPLKG